MKIIILGANGMLGHVLFEQLLIDERFDVYATVRSTDYLSHWVPEQALSKIITGIDANNFGTIKDTIKEIRPDVVINCIGLIKQLAIASHHIPAITINSLFPHQIALACKEIGCRMIHISTDCVFDGRKGNYTENDTSNADDLYGRTKYLGEIDKEPHCITIRTSIVGHELKNKVGLVDWFLSQKKVQGFTDAIYSGFPTVELYHIIRDYIFPNPDISGVYNVSSDPISKYDILQFIVRQYKKQIEIEPYGEFKIDRSLNSMRFRSITGYQPPSWENLIKMMYEHFMRSACYK